MDSIKCPCCGGLTTNYLNCDYCGSYLIRFIKRNLSYDEASLGNDTKIILGIQEELQANLDEQFDTRSQNHICSKTQANGYTLEVKNPRSVGDSVKYNISGRNCYINPTNPFDENEISLVLVVRSLDFKKLLSENDSWKEKQLEERQKIDWLKHVGLYEICAKCDDEIKSLSGIQGVCHSFYLNFGKDVAGATKALSSFVYGISGPKGTSNLKFTRYSEPDIKYRYKQEELKEDKKMDKIKLYEMVLCFFVSGLIVAAYPNKWGLIPYEISFCIICIASICAIVWIEVKSRRI